MGLICGSCMACRLMQVVASEAALLAACVLHRWPLRVELLDTDIAENAQVGVFVRCFVRGRSFCVLAAVGQLWLIAGCMSFSWPCVSMYACSGLRSSFVRF